MARPLSRKRVKDLSQVVAVVDLAIESRNPNVQRVLDSLIHTVAEHHAEELADLTSDTLQFATSTGRLRERAFRATLVAINTDDAELREVLERLVNVVARKHPRHFLTTS